MKIADIAIARIKSDMLKHEYTYPPYMLARQSTN